MIDPEEEAYSEGQLAALHAISHGVPRFIVMQGMDEDMIDSRTGLPLATLSAPPNLAAWQGAFVRGFNEAILRAVESGEVTRDFRPLLLTRKEVKDAFRDRPLGTLSLDCRRLEDPNGRFVLHLDIPIPRKTSNRGAPRSEQPARILIDHTTGECDRTLLYYDAPVEVALGRDGRVVLIKTDCLFLAFDEETTQILHRYRIA
jgi:hypothetical protein